MRRRNVVQVVAALAVSALLATACGSDDDEAADSSPTTQGSETSESPSTDAPPSGDHPDIVLAQNAWTASNLNVEIAKQLIEQELGNSVELLAIDENLQFAGLADGTIDATLEIWPSGVTADEQAYFDDGSVANIGELGAIGKIGWYVPDYVIEENPSVATWEGLKDPEIAKLFATAETGDLGRFLGTDPSYSQYDEPIIANLELPFQVVFSGSEEATVAELDTRVAAGEPVLMYWWTPTAAVGKYNLVNVALPENTPGCLDVIEDVACDYPEDVLFKAASASLAEKDPAVWAFLEKFSMTNDDQLSMLPSVEIDKEDAAEVAAAWIADNEDVWSAWFA